MAALGFHPSFTDAFMNGFGWFGSAEHIPSQVIYNGTTTIAIFPDGKKIKARPDKGAAFDPETGLAMCIAKHVYGSRAAFLKAVEGATNQNKVEPFSLRIGARCVDFGKSTRSIDG